VVNVVAFSSGRDATRARAHSPLVEGIPHRSMTRVSLLCTHDPRDHQTRALCLPQAQALEARQDFLDDRGQLVSGGADAEAEPIEAGFGEVLAHTGDPVGLPHC